MNPQSFEVMFLFIHKCDLIELHKNLINLGRDPFKAIYIYLFAATVCLAAPHLHGSVWGCFNDQPYMAHDMLFILEKNVRLEA